MIYQYLVLGYIAFVLIFPKISLITLSGVTVPVRLEDFLLLVILILFALRKNFLKNFLKALSSPLSLLLIGWLSLMFVSTTYNVIFNHLSVSSYLFVLRFVEYAALFYLGYVTNPSKKFRFTRPSQKVAAVKPRMNTLGRVILRSFSEGGLTHFNVLVALGILVSAWALLQIMGAVGGFGGGFYQYTYIKGTDRAFASFSGPYELAGFLIVLIPIIVGMFMVARERKLKLFYLAALVAAIMAMGFSGARFPVICAFLAVLSLAFARRELKYRLTVGVLALMTLLLPFFVSETLVMRFQFLAGTFESFREEQKKEIQEEPLSPVVEEEAAEQSWQEQEIQEEPLSPVVEEEDDAVDKKVVTGEIPQREGLEVEEGKVSLFLSGLVKKAANLAGEIKKRTSVFVNGINERRKAFIKRIEERGSILVGKLKQADPSLRWRLGETWPRAIGKVKENPLLGGGMGSIGVGLDGEYATLLGETGILGLAVFLALLLKIITETLKKVRGLEDYRSRVLVFTLISVTIGLAANAVFADIFRASKIAFLFWYLVGASLGIKEEV